MALSCHMAMGLFCQEMRGACWELKVVGLTSFAVFTVPGQLSCGIITAKKPF